MPIANIRIPSFMGGVSRLSQNQRTSFEMEAMDNCDMQPTRGTDKRNALEHIAGVGGTQEALNITLVADAFTFWINRSATERFIGFVDPDGTDLNVIQIFNIVTGVQVTVQAIDPVGGGVVNLDDPLVDDLITYLTTGTQTIRERFRSVTVEDSTFILNREVVTSLEGVAITYTNTDGVNLVRNQNNAQNQPAWVDFDQPPTDTETYPSRTILVEGGNIPDLIPGVHDAIWYARDDDIGLPQGFYWAVSGTQPPWFQRLPTEGALSFIQRDTMPLRLAFTGSQFNLQFVDWTERRAGDSTTNPGPSFIGLRLNDMTFHQGRFVFLAGERIVTSRVNDLFNLWIDSTATNILTDADPIDRGIQGRRISNGLFAQSFRESVIIITDGNRQLEMRANGPLTPGSVQLYDSTNVFSVGYVEPVIKGSQLYFAGERDFGHILWEYNYDPEQITNVASDLTERIHGYIPAQVHTMATSDSHDQIFCLSLADTDAIYVNKQIYSGADRVLNSWYRWVFPGVDEVMSCFVFDDFLYMVNRRTDPLAVQRVYLERMPLGQPEQDTTGSPAQTLGYATRIDRKQEIQGIYVAVDDETTFTIPFEDANIDTIVLSATWDTALVKAAGTVLIAADFISISTTDTPGSTIIVVEGDFENNADGDDAPAWVGRQYIALIELSRQYVRDQQGSFLHGNTHLMRAKVRHRDSGGYKVRITPEGRAELTKDFIVPNIGSTPLDSDQLDAFGEFQFRVMAHAENLTVQLINDSPFPTAWVDMEIDVEFIPQSYSPVR